MLDARVTAETHDGALIYVSHQGVADYGEDGYQKSIQGTLPPTVPFRCALRYQTAHPEYRWLNRLHCLGVGEIDRERNRMSMDIYAVQ